MSHWQRPGQSTSSMKRRASHSATPYLSRKRHCRDGAVSESLGSDRTMRDGSIFNSVNDSIVHGNIDKFLSDNTIKIKNINYYGRYPELCRFLSPLDPDSRHSTIREKLTKGTGEWLLNLQRFQEWKGGEEGPQVLCLLGEPGTGKSSLFCHVVNNLRSEEIACRAVVASVYCDYQDQGRHTARNLAGALLSQVVIHLEDGNEVLEELEQRRRSNRSLSTDECVTFLCKATTAGEFDTVWFCLDALDELISEERDKLLRKISSVCQFPMIRIFLTGRSNAGVDDSIKRSLLTSSPAIVVEYIPTSTKNTSKDICLFLEKRLRDDSNPSLMEDKLRMAIFRQLAGRESTFLLAALNIGKVLRGKTTRRREKALNDLALNLDIYYEEMVDRIKRQDEDYGLRILHWILFATRPLTLKELQYAVAIEPGTTEFESSKDLPSSSIIDSTLGLATVDRGLWSQTVRFVHFTFKEHLFRNSSLYFPRGHALLADATLTYLSFDAMDTEDGRARYANHGDLHTFLGYAAGNWGIHVRQQEDDYIVERVCGYLKSGKFNRLQLLNDSGVPYSRQRSTGLWWASPLHAVSYFGLYATLTRLMPPGIRAGDTLNSRGGMGEIPVLPSPRRSDADSPRTPAVLDNINSNLADPSGALEIGKRHLACANIDVESPNGIGQQDFDINYADKYGWTPLIVAIESGHTEIVKQLLERKAVSVNVQADGEPPLFGVLGGDRFRQSRTPLLIALDNGQLEIARLLLEREDINVNLSDRSGRTPLSIAVNKAHLGIVTQILRRNDTHPAGLGIALYNSISAGHLNIAESLIEHKSTDVNYQDKSGQTPLCLALFEGHLEIVTQLLQRKDIDVNLPNRFGEAAFSVALDKGHLGIANQLLEREEINVNGGTPLHIAIDKGHLEIVHRIMERNDIDVNFRDRYRSTPLWIAACKGCQETVTQLLQRKDIDVNLPDHFGQVPLLIALDTGRIGIAKQLLEREEINTNLPDQFGRTPYSVALANGYYKIAKQLFERMLQ